MSTPATESDIATAFKRFADTSDLEALLTGGWHHQQPPASAAMPWAVCKVEESAWQQYSTGAIATYRVTVEVRSQEGLHNQTAIAQALARFNRTHFLTLPGTDANVVHCLPVPGKLTAEQQQHQARDVALTVKMWDVVVRQPKGGTDAMVIGVDSAAVGDSTAATAIGVDA